MNYYIDFDNTLYNSYNLQTKMLKEVANLVHKNRNIDFEEIYNECNLVFKDNIYELAKYFSNKYNLNQIEMKNIINNAILNGRDNIYEDVIPFLENLKKKGHNLFILSYCKDNLEYQSLKIVGSQICDYFDAFYITTRPKYTLDIDYKNGIFVDDNVSDIIGLYSKNAKQVIRIRRKENKHSIEELENHNIEEFEKLTDIPIN